MKSTKHRDPSFLTYYEIRQKVGVQKLAFMPSSPETQLYRLYGFRLTTTLALHNKHLFSTPLAKPLLRYPKHGDARRQNTQE